MKERQIVLVLSTLVVLAPLAPVMAQVFNLGYTIHVDFYSYSCSLDTVQVSIFDQAGHLVGEASSPYGSEVAISFRTSAPTYSLTAIAFGRASTGSYFSRPVSGSRMISVATGGDYWILVLMH